MYTKFYNRMIVDVRGSTQFSEEFIKERKENGGEGSEEDVELEFFVLEQGVWKIDLREPPKIPKELATIEQDFEKFYQGKHKTRRLTWIYSYGTCTLEYVFDANTKYRIEAHHYHALVLLLFNEKERYSFQEI